MKTSLAVIIIVLILSSTVKANQGYFLVEVYPNAAELINFGQSYNGYKLDIWAFPGSEVGLTMGPVIGPFAIGIGASGVGDNGRYLNADVFFSWKLSLANISGTSYNLFQKDLGGNIDDFILSKNWISFNNLPFGIVGHNTKSGGQP